MSRLTKTLSVIVAFILLTLMLSLVATNAVDAFLPTPLLGIRQLATINLPFHHWLASYQFWVALVLSVIIVVGLLIILFFPRLRTDILLEEKAGQLTLGKSAIEGLVKSVVEDHRLMKNPQVTAKLYKRKFKIKVKGDIVPKYDVVNRTAALKSDIERTLREFVGVNQPLNLTVVVTQVTDTHSANTSRVI